jgi:hypothetical protein
MDVHGTANRKRQTLHRIFEVNGWLFKVRATYALKLKQELATELWKTCTL